MTITEIAKQIKEGSLSALEAVQNSLAKIKETNPKTNAFLEVFEEEALLRAKQIDKNPKEGALCGVPVAIKDNIMYEGHTVSCGSKMLENYKAPYNAFVVEKLLKAGAIIVGRTNMDEFAMGSSNENSAFGAVKNPLDLQRVPGGSSGGSAAAVAAKAVPLALGSDTGGSIRQPAAFCGLYGIKPTYGRVSRYGLVAFASSADQIGALTRTSSDSELALSVLSGYDEKDSTSAQKEPYCSDAAADVSNFTVGIPKEFFENLNPQIANAVMEAKKVLEKGGVKFKDISLPYAKYSSPCYYILTSSEASSNLARFDGLRYGKHVEADNLEQAYLKDRAFFGPEVKRRIMLGTYSLASAHAQDYYKKAQAVRALIRRDFTTSFCGLDAILTPSTPSTAFKIGEKIDDIISLYLSDLYTAPANIAGVPALSAPFGKDDKNLPIGIQFYGNYFEENKIYALAKYLEKTK